MKTHAVLFLINKLKVGGSEKLFREERDALEKDGIRAYLAPLYDSSAPNGVPKEFISLPRFNGLFDIGACVRILQFVKEKHISVIHATLEHASIVARILGFFLPGVRIAISEPGMADRKPLRYKLIDIALNLRTDVLIAGSQNVKKSLESYQPFYKKKIVIVMNGVRVPDKFPQRKENTTFTILAVGSLRQEKGFDMLIQAFGRFVKQTNADARLVIIGKGSLEKNLKHEAASAGVTDRVMLVGEQPEANVADWQKQSHVFAMSSVSEGGPFVLLEAMASGTPVVATAVGCVPDVMTDEIEGLVVHPGNPDALAGAFIRLYRDSALRERLAKTAFAKVKKVGTFERHMALLKQALGVLV